MGSKTKGTVTPSETVAEHLVNPFEDPQIRELEEILSKLSADLSQEDEKTLHVAALKSLCGQSRAFRDFARLCSLRDSAESLKDQVAATRKVAKELMISSAQRASEDAEHEHELMNFSSSVFRLELESLAVDVKGFAADLSWMQEAVKVVNKALHVCRDESEICLAFNGGKDCTALLFLVLPFWRNKFPTAKLKLLYIHDQSDKDFDFPEEREFVQSLTSAMSGNVMLLEICNSSMKTALDQLRQSHPAIRMIFMGTRKSDPHGNKLSVFDPTDVSWPAFVRINPLLNWSYHNIWNFLRSMHLPFCPLYLQGYTSVGSIHNTKPNPLLRRPDNSYAPAWELPDTPEADLLERAGRS